MDITIGFIGFGLIGGSIAKGIKRAYPNYKIMAYSRTKSSLEQAYNDGIINTILDAIDNRLSICDFIFLCTPVSFNASYLSAISPFIKPTCIVTDVGSTKTGIHEQVIRLGLESSFIGGHPMAGSERTGYENSTDHLLENAYYVITPTNKTTKAQLERYISLVKNLGALPLVLDYKEHDYVVATISHLPHIIAAELVNLVKASDNKNQTMKMVAAGGFKDITRIASCSPIMWEQICMDNHLNIESILQQYIERLQLTLSHLKKKQSNKIFQLFESSGEYRNSITDSFSGPITPEYCIYCDIVDEAGAIATIATTLSIHQISIKNIGIIHNREFEEGVLKIEFYNEVACKKATEVLEFCHYTVFQKNR